MRCRSSPPLRAILQKRATAWFMCSWNTALTKSMDMTVVFDALFASGEEHREKITPHFEVVYTSEGVTADSCIERLAYESVRTSREVHVVTSDGAEQSAILGAGAYRISSAELWRRVKKTKKKIADEYLGEVTLPLSRNEVGSRIDSRTAAKLDALRKRSR